MSASPGAAKKEPSKEAAATETKTPKRRNAKPREEDPYAPPAPHTYRRSHACAPSPARARAHALTLEDRKPGTSTALTRTPGSSLVSAETLPLPPSPAAIAGHIDRTRQRATASLRGLYARSGLVGTVEALRQRASAGASVELLALALEAAGLRPALLPNKYLTTLPASRALGTAAVPVQVPDLFALLRGDFWRVFSLWFMASVLLPMTVAYFFNVTLKVKGARAAAAARGAGAGAGVVEYDPLTFNVAKGLLAYVVFGCGFQVFEYPSFESRLVIEEYVPGGYKGILISTGIGALVNLYEAILRKH